MQRIGLISKTVVPTANCLPVDPFLCSYTKFDFILVITFLYLGLIEKKSISVPRHSRVKSQRQRRISQEEIQSQNTAKEYYNNNKVGARYMREKWRLVENKVKISRMLWLEQVQVKSSKEEGRNELMKYTRSREETFEHWKTYFYDDNAEENEEDELGQDLSQRMEALEKGEQVSVRYDFEEW